MRFSPRGGGGSFCFDFRGSLFAGDDDRPSVGHATSQGGLDGDRVSAEVKAHPLAPMPSVDRRPTSIDGDLRSARDRAADCRARHRQRVATTIEMERDRSGRDTRVPRRGCSLRGRDRRAATAAESDNGGSKCQGQQSAGARWRCRDPWRGLATIRASMSSPGTHDARTIPCTPDEWITPVSWTDNGRTGLEGATRSLLGGMGAPRYSGGTWLLTCGPWYRWSWSLHAAGNLN